MLSHVDLKKLSLRLRDLGSRLLRSDGDSAKDNIRRLQRFVIGTPLLHDAVTAAPAPAGDLLVLWQTVQNAGNRLPLPESAEEELGLLHAMLAALANNPEEFWKLCYNYAGEEGINEPVDQVLHDLGGKYVGHLRQIIEFAMLDSGDPALGAARAIHVQLHGGEGHQVNVAADSGQIHALQVRNAGGLELLAAARELTRVAAEMIQRGESVVVAEEARELAGSVAEEVQRPAPRRFTLASLGARLKQIAELRESLASLAPHAAQLAGLIDRVVAALG